MLSTVARFALESSESSSQLARHSSTSSKALLHPLLDHAAGDRLLRIAVRFLSHITAQRSDGSDTLFTYAFGWAGRAVRHESKRSTARLSAAAHSPSVPSRATRFGTRTDHEDGCGRHAVAGSACNRARGVRRSRLIACCGSARDEAVDGTAKQWPPGVPCPRAPASTAAS